MHAAGDEDDRFALGWQHLSGCVAREASPGRCEGDLPNCSRIGEFGIDLFVLFEVLEVLRRADRRINKRCAHRRFADLLEHHAVARGVEFLKIIDDTCPTREFAIVARCETERVFWSRESFEPTG